LFWLFLILKRKTNEGQKIDAPPGHEGFISGGVLGKSFRGLWDEVSQTITLTVRVGGPDDFPTIALFKGYLFISPPNPEPGRDVVVTLSGSVQVNETGGFPAASGASRRNIFGWFAQITHVL
jgi:hypothetical protein